jgi:hypothetical protein
VILDHATVFNAKRPPLVGSVSDVHDQFSILLDILDFTLGRILILVVRHQASISNSKVTENRLCFVRHLRLCVVTEQFLWRSVRLNVIFERFREITIGLNRVHGKVSCVISDEDLEAVCSPVPGNTIGSTLTSM